MKKLSKAQVKHLRSIDDGGYGYAPRQRTLTILLERGLVEATNVPIDKCGPPWQLTSAGFIALDNSNR